jgi:hypothetical protein
MRRTRLIIPLLTLAVMGVAATYYPGGLGRFYGDTTLTNLVTGAVYFNTASNTFWVGGSTSNPVKVGTIGVATTGDIASAVSSLVATNDSRALRFTNEVTVGNLLLVEPRWTDSPMVFMWPGVGIGSPSLRAFDAPFAGITTLAFEDNDVLHGVAQIPHSIAQTNAANVDTLFTELHAHITPLTAPPANANRTRIVFTYSACNIGGAMAGPWVTTNEVVLTAGQIGQHYADAAQIAPTNFWPGISAIYFATMKRIAATASNYTGYISITSDIHFPMDRIGSAEETAP